MTRPLLNIAAGKPEMIGTFEQVIIKCLLPAAGNFLVSNKQLARLRRRWQNDRYEYNDVKKCMCANQFALRAFGCV